MRCGKGFFTIEALFSLVCLLALLCSTGLGIATHTKAILFLQASDFAEVCVQNEFEGMEEALHLLGLKARVERNWVVLLDQEPENSVVVFRDYVENCAVVRARFEVGM